jgi:HAD superfamily hydrolase (TIGR01509 family)
MIRNIIFDLGNVLLSWKPDEYLETTEYSKKEITIILDDIFRSNEWLKLDNGDLTVKEAIDIISTKSSLNRALIERVFENRIEILHPLTDNVKLLPVLKKRGYRLYYLSNFPKDLFQPVLDRNDFFSFFDGGLISADLRLSKPDVRIFKTLLDKYKLKSEESLFIDDLHANIMGARESGIKSIHLDHHHMLGEYIKEILG